MILKGKDKQDKLAEAQEYYSRASNAHSAKRDDFRKYNDQYNGSHEIDGFITNEEGEVVEKAKAADTVWNISFELLEGSIDTDLPQPFVTPEMRCEHNIRNARRIENLIKMLMDKYPFEEYNDEQERSTKKFGTSAVNIEWDTNVTTRSTVGEATVEIMRPHNIYPQPHIKDIRDCDYIFVNYVTTKAAIMRKYSLSEKDVEDTEFRFEYDDDDDTIKGDEDVVTLTVLWYKNDKGNVCRFVYSGDLVLEDDDDYYSRKVEYCKTCGRRRQICEQDECKRPDYYTQKLDYDELTEDLKCSDGRIIPAMSPVIKDGGLVFETVKMPVTNDDGSQLMDVVGGIEVPAFMEVQVPKMQPTRLPFYKPKTLPVAIRYNIRNDDSFWGISDMEVIREQQQECNKLTSRIHEAVMKSGAALMKPKEAEFTPSNTIFDATIELDNSMDSRQYGVYSYAVDISQWLVERDNQKEQAKRLLGISDSFLGQADNTAKSGIAKQISVSQSAGRLASKKVMKQSHFADIFRRIFELYLAYADEPRQIYHSDDPGSDCQRAFEELFNRNDFYEWDPKTGEWYINDNFTFATDQNGAWEQQYPQLWEIVKSDYLAGMYGDPADINTQICVWQHLEQFKYPFARNIVELKKKQKEEMLLAQQQAAAQGGMLPQGQSGGTPPELAATGAMNGGAM